VSMSCPVRANAQATAELEFHISPAPSSSLPQVRTGISRNIASTAATVAGSEVVRTGLSTASATSGMTPSRQQRTS